MTPAQTLRRALTTVPLALALALTACGGDDPDDPGAGSGDGPAALAPADAPVYFESVIRPEGEAADTIERLYTAFTGQEDAGAAITAELDATLQEDGGDFSFEGDIEPWLGERGGLFFSDAESLVASGDVAGCVESASGSSSFPPVDEGCAVDEPGSEPQDFALVVESTDDDAATEAIDKAVEISTEQVEGTEVGEGSYEGVDYTTVDQGDGTFAVGVNDGFVILGDEAGFESAVDAAAGDGLADSSEFTDTVSELEDDPYFALYADTPEIVDAAESAGSLTPEDQAALRLYGNYLDAPIAFTGAIDDEGISLASSTGSTGLELSAEGLLDDVPADAFAAFGFPSLGEYSTTLLDQLRQDAEFGRQLDVASAQFEREVGISVDDLVSGLGDVEGFVRGDSVLALDGAIAVEVSDPGAAADAIGALTRAAESSGERVTPVNGIEGLDDATGFSVQPDGAPQAVYVVVSDDRLIASYGERAAAEAISPSEPLGDDEAFGEAADELEDVDPSFYLDFDPIAQLVSSVPVSTDEFDPAQVTEALGEFDYLIGGAGTDGDRDITRYRLGLAE